MTNREDHSHTRLHSNSPRFVVFEGIDGSGKTLQARMLGESLSREGFSIVLTAEPSDGPNGKLIRSLKVRPSPEEEERLFTEDRRDHIARVIVPALKLGRIVICDRYFYSSVAYQGARGIDPAGIIARNLSFVVVPDLILLLEVPLDEALNRIKVGRPEGFSSFEEQEGLEAVDRIYRSLEDPLIKRIDGSGSPERVHESVLKTFWSQAPVYLSLFFIFSSTFIYSFVPTY